MNLRALILTGVAVPLFALPALARADSCQGAGDCQYQDPFGNSQPQPKTKPKTNTNPTAPAPTQQTPTQSAPVTQSQPSSTPAATTTTPTSGWAGT